MTYLLYGVWYVYTTSIASRNAVIHNNIRLFHHTCAVLTVVLKTVCPSALTVNVIDSKLKKRPYICTAAPRRASRCYDDAYCDDVGVVYF